MVKDKLKNMVLYSAMIPYFQKILKFFDDFDAQKLKAGRYSIVEDKMYANIEKYYTQEFETKNYEVHHEYMDIQCVMKGKESIFFTYEERLKKKATYDILNDIFFYEDGDRTTQIDVSENEFVLISPGEAHKPCIICGEKQYVTKIIFKIRV